jgi:hypothetical protein
MVRVVSTSFVPAEVLEDAPEIFAWNEHNNPEDPDIPSQPQPSAEDAEQPADRKGVRLL